MAFHIPHVQILGTNQCGDSCQTAFKISKSFQDVLCRRDYDERLVASSSHKIQSEYHRGNISVSIEGIALKVFIVLPKTGLTTSTKQFPRHAVFHPFFDDSKQDDATTNLQRKYLIEPLK